MTLLAALTGCTASEPVTYLLPDGFSGLVYVVFDQPTGQPERRDDGRRVYEIPADGLLLTQFGPNDGTVDERFAYVRPDGTQHEIVGRETSTIHDTAEARTDTTVTVNQSAVGTMDAAGGKKASFAMHVIGTRAQILDRDAFQDEQRMTGQLKRSGVTE